MEKTIIETKNFSKEIDPLINRGKLKAEKFEVFKNYLAENVDHEI